MVERTFSIPMKDSLVRLCTPSYRDFVLAAQGTPPEVCWRTMILLHYGLLCLAAAGPLGYSLPMATEEG